MRVVSVVWFWSLEHHVAYVILAFAVLTSITRLRARGVVGGGADVVACTPHAFASKGGCRRRCGSRMLLHTPPTRLQARGGVDGGAAAGRCRTPPLRVCERRGSVAAWRLDRRCRSASRRGCRRWRGDRMLSHTHTFTQARGGIGGGVGAKHCRTPHAFVSEGGVGGGVAAAHGRTQPPLVCEREGVGWPGVVAHSQLQARRGGDQ
jgi:hypothetical protein